MKTDNTQNPWKGLQPYDDNASDLACHPFCGREAAIHEIFALIDDNIATTLYGKSGIGKTSLLKAGVFPILRENRYVPIYVRLNIHTLANCTYADIIIKEIYEICHKECIDVLRKKSLDISSDHPDFLWLFFAGTEFKDSKGNIVFPVVMFDQFEEIFNADTGQDSVKTLLHQLRELMNENKLYGASAPIINYRLVLSIREDDLFLLEEAVDAYHVEELKLNRYRLKSLTEAEAKEIIDIGDKYIEESNKKEIVRIILKKSFYKDTNVISTDMLSLTCSQLFIQTHGQITLEFIKKLDDSLLENFYLESMKLVSPQAKEFIEEKLEKDARRSVVLEEVLKEKLTPDEYDILSKGEHKILHSITIDSVKYVELIHDSLSQAIDSLHKKKAEMEQIASLEKRKRKLKVRLLVFIPAVILLLLSVIVYLLNANQNLKDTQGLGVKQEFLIAFSEDSAVVADNEFWKANLRVKGHIGDKDTILVDMVINKSFRDSIIRVEAINAESFTISLDFQSLQNRKVYKSQVMEKTLDFLMENKEVKLKIRYDKKNMVTYKGKIMMRIDDQEYILENAIVVVHDKIARTNSQGEFVYLFEDSLQKNELITIVRPGLASIEENFFEKDKPKELFVLTPSDSLASFKRKCAEIDSVKTWYYSSARHKGIVVKKNGKKDHLLIFANRKKGKVVNGKFIIWGYYYFLNEYNSYDDNKKYLSYHIFTGQMDSVSQDRKSSPMYKWFEVTGYDKVGNQHIMKGCRKKTNGLFVAGEIWNVNGVFATYGNKADSTGFKNLQEND